MLNVLSWHTFIVCHTGDTGDSLRHLNSGVACPHLCVLCVLVTHTFVDILNNSWTIAKSSCLVSVLPVCHILGPGFLNKSYYVTSATAMDSPPLKTWTFLPSDPMLGIYY